MSDQSLLLSFPAEVRCSIIWGTHPTHRLVAVSVLGGSNKPPRKMMWQPKEKVCEINPATRAAVVSGELVDYPADTPEAAFILFDGQPAPDLVSFQQMS